MGEAAEAKQEEVKNEAKHYDMAAADSDDDDGTPDLVSDSSSDEERPKKKLNGVEVTGSESETESDDGDDVFDTRKWIEEEKKRRET